MTVIFSNINSGRQPHFHEGRIIKVCEFVHDGLKSRTTSRQTFFLKFKSLV